MSDAGDISNEPTTVLSNTAETHASREHRQEHRNERHGKHRAHRGRRSARRKAHRFARAILIVASIVFFAAAFFAFLYDHDLRQPATDDFAGDPPTQYLLWALALGLLGTFCIFATIYRGRNGSKWQQS